MHPETILSPRPSPPPGSNVGKKGGGFPNRSHISETPPPPCANSFQPMENPLVKESTGIFMMC